jgi:beta-phosphoglucomutase-like phosphatase (HAD superfamily)
MPKRSGAVATRRCSAPIVLCSENFPRDQREMQMAGSAPYFEDRIFSGHDLPRSKPAPDVYQAAAARLRAVNGRLANGRTAASRRCAFKQPHSRVRQNEKAPARHGWGCLSRV